MTPNTVTSKNVFNQNIWRGMCISQFQRVYLGNLGYRLLKENLSREDIITIVKAIIAICESNCLSAGFIACSQNPMSDSECETIIIESDRRCQQAFSDIGKTLK